MVGQSGLRQVRLASLALIPRLNVGLGAGSMHIDGSFINHMTDVNFAGMEVL